MEITEISEPSNNLKRVKEKREANYILLTKEMMQTRKQNQADISLYIFVLYWDLPNKSP
jgi:hypothetical protein